MAKTRRNTELIRDFILDNIDDNQKELISYVANKFGISRQSVHRHIKFLVDQKILIHTEYGQYEIGGVEQWSETLSISDHTQEDVVWRIIIAPQIGKLPDNALNIWHYGFTEMFNNVVDHSEGNRVTVTIKKTAYTTEMSILDDGVGVFTKIKNAMNLLDERHAVLELTKGKLTTDPARHTGEGIFFSSRMFDSFSILSGEVFLSHKYKNEEDWILENSKYQPGTFVTMKLKNKTERSMREIFDKFTDNFGFTKTVVPVRLAQYGNEKLVSRSQAKRLLERVDRFKTVLFDFSEVEIIGQAFADEVFRVFAVGHPNIEIIPINANDDVTRIIQRSMG
jgi:anti-sigma regulatory factor (Ser/Thr protein kinase)